MLPDRRARDTKPAPSVLINTSALSSLIANAARRSESSRTARTPGQRCTTTRPGRDAELLQTMHRCAGLIIGDCDAGVEPVADGGPGTSDTLPQLSPAMIVGSEVSTLTGLPAARLAVTQAAETGSMASTAGRCVQCRIAIVLQCGLEQRSDTGGHCDQVDRGLVELRGDLAEQRSITLHDPLGDLFVALPCGVLDEQIVGVTGGRTGSGPYHFVVDQVGSHHLGTLAGDCLHGLLGRSRRNVNAGCQAEQRGHSPQRATMVPVRCRDQSDRCRTVPELGQVRAGSSKPLRWLSAQFTAQEAPRILKAGNPRRSDSSLTSTDPTPSSVASSGSFTSGVGW